MRRRVAPVAVLVLLALGLGVAAEAASAETAANGGALFEQFCASCHTIGGGDKVGPDLEGVTTRLEAEELQRIILEGIPGAMPNPGLNEEQAADVIAYIALESGDPPPDAAPTPAEPAPAEEPAPVEEPVPAEEPEPIAEPAEPAPIAVTDGDPELGKDLFTGAERFDNEGATCLSCHQIAGTGSLGGGQVGPDLTGAYERFGDGYIAFLATGTMGPIFDDKPLTEQEAADLGAFMAEAAGQPEPSSEAAAARFVAIGIGGALALLLLGLVIWRDRLGSVRKRLVREHSATRGK